MWQDLSAFYEPVEFLAGYAEVSSNFLAFMPFLIIIIYSKAISQKRRKALKILAKARGHMLFGEIFNDTVREILEAVKFNKKNTTYSHSIVILNDMIALEKKKRLQSMMYLAVILNASLFSFYDRIGVYITPTLKYLPTRVRNYIEASPDLSKILDFLP